MANTVIQIKRSQNNALPTSLQYGEQAYSFLSGKLAIGNTTGVPIVIGGNTYVQTIDSATSSNTFSTLVKRDTAGNFSASAIFANLYGNANTATKLLNGRNFNIGGNGNSDVSSDYVGFDGTAGVILTANLVNIAGLSAGTYGGSTAIPTFTVDSKGRITSVSNTSISTGFNVTGNSGSISFSSGQTLQFLGNDGLSASVSTNTVTISHDSSFIRTTGGQTINNGLTIGSGGLAISGDLSVTGNTYFTGNTSYANVSSYIVSDPVLYIAGNNYTSDIVSIGFAGNYFDGNKEMHTGLFRKAASNNYYLFVNVWDELSNVNNISTSANGFMLANLNSNLTGGVISGLASAIKVADGGTGVQSLTAGQILVGNGTGGIQSVANVSAVNTTLTNKQTVNNITTDTWGRVTGFTTQSIGNLDVSQGGTGNTAFSPGNLIAANATGALVSLANTSTPGVYGNSSYIPVITTDNYGRVTSVSNTAINLNVSNISSGILSYLYGGTNSSSAPTAGGIAYGNGSAILTTTAGSTGQALLSQGSNSPIFGTLDLRGGGLGITSLTANSVMYYSGSGNAMSYTNGPSDGNILQYSANVGIQFGMLDGGSF